MLSFFPRGVLDKILNLIESVSEDFPSYSFIASNDHYFNKRRIVDTDVVNDVTFTHQMVITRVVIRFLLHDVIH